MSDLEKEKQSTDLQLADLRAIIDNIDSQLLDLINERLLTARKIGWIKSAGNRRVKDRSRERQVLSRLEKLNRGPLKVDDLHHLFMEIIGITREIQSNDVIAYLGPEATFTHIAALEYFGHKAPLKAYASVAEIYGVLAREEVRYAVIPVDNTVEGVDGGNLDLLIETEAVLCGEQYLAVAYDLLSPGTTIDNVQKIYGQVHAVSQCRGWLRKYLPDTQLVECATAAEATALTLAGGEAALVGPPAFARLHNWRTLMANIADHRQPLSRFLVFGPQAEPPTGCDKTSLLFVTDNRPGALFRILEPVQNAGVNVCRLDSRLWKRENWRSVFYLDIEGHMQDKIIADVIAAIKQACHFLKVLGSYPMSTHENNPA